MTTCSAALRAVSEAHSQAPHTTHTCTHAPLPKKQSLLERHTLSADRICSKTAAQPTLQAMWHHATVAKASLTTCLQCCRLAVKEQASSLQAVPNLLPAMMRCMDGRNRGDA